MHIPLPLRAGLALALSQVPTANPRRRDKAVSDRPNCQDSNTRAAPRALNTVVWSKNNVTNLNIAA